MLRLVLFAISTLVVFLLLPIVPVVGPILQRVPLIGLFVAASVVGWAVSRFGTWALAHEREKSLMRELGAVDTPYNRGKLGTMLLGQGRPARAEPHLRAALENDPEAPEWNYRLGCALLSTGRTQDAIPFLRKTVEREEEHAYGAAQLRLAEALSATRSHEDALSVLQTFERNHGPSPECSYRRGLALKALGRRDEAGTAFNQVSELAKDAVGFKKREGLGWSARAAWSRFF